MAFKKHGRKYDIVVFGATGYTGKLVVEHITTQLPTNLKWAVAGRNQVKLEDVLNDVKALNPDRPQPAIEVCTLDGPSLANLAKSTFVLITTVGSFTKYGEHAFKACAENGTHYVDATGEVPWVAKMIKKYEASAKTSGAIMIPLCAIESVPSDVMTWALVDLNRSEFGAETKETVISFSLKGRLSGGTLTTALAMFDEFTLSEFKDAFTPFSISPVPHPGPVSRPGIISMLTGLRTVPNLGLLTSSVTSPTNCATIGRSWGLMNTIPSRQKQAYGPKFTVNEYMKARNHLIGVGMHFGLIILAMIVAISPVRRLIKRFIYKPGEGPTKEQVSKDRIEYRAVAWPDVEAGAKDIKGAGKQAYGRASFDGSMYTLSAICLVQAALTILEEDLELDGNIYTPACLGQPYVNRLAATGFRIETNAIDEK